MSRSFTKQRGRLVPDRGYKLDRIFQDVHSHPCPTCEGVGKVYDLDEIDRVDQAHREQNESWQACWGGRITLLNEAAETVLLALPSLSEKAKGLAAETGHLAQHWDLPWCEDFVRNEFLARLCEIKARNPHLTWEDMRVVAVRLFPGLKYSISHWRAMRMASVRARSRIGSPFYSEPVFLKPKLHPKKGWVVPLEIMGPLPPEYQGKRFFQVWLSLVEQVKTGALQPPFPKWLPPSWRRLLPQVAAMQLAEGKNQ
jgi:hypothetical protein